MCTRTVLVLASVLLAERQLPAQARRPAPPATVSQVQTYETRYYILQTDLPVEQAREVALRMTAMAEEYWQRTRDFSGTIRQKFDFFVYRRADDYYASGAPRGSAGLFDGRSLKAIAGEKLNDNTWRTIQHEGFHQFAHHVIGTDNMPIWVNEGLAEYFGEAIFTGDGFITGYIPSHRVKRIRKSLETGRMRHVEEMMQLSHEQWNAELDLSNYDQAWAMVQFLAHADDGKYQRAFASFMVQISKGKPWTNAWRDSFGDSRGFEERFRDWWMAQPDEPTPEVFLRATVATWTSLLARAVSQKQTFKDFDALRQSAANGELKFHRDDWLPDSLREQALRWDKRLDRQQLKLELVPATRGSLPTVVCTLPDGSRLVGSFTLKGQRVGDVVVKTVNPPKPRAS